MSESENQITVKAVLAWNKQNNQRAEQQKAADPYAKPYTVGDAYCRNLCSAKARQREEALLEENPNASAEKIEAARAKGPADALAELKLNATRHLKAYQQELEEARRREKKHANLHKADQERKRKDRLKQTLGQRVDAVFAEFAVIAAASATSTLEGRVTGSKDPSPLRPVTKAPGADAYDRVLEAVKRAEAELEQVRYRAELLAA
jgi:hypothetical protein